MKIMLSGCHGQVGRAISPALLAAGHQLTGIDSRDGSAPYPCVRLDIRASIPSALLRSTEVLVHCAFDTGLANRNDGYSLADAYQTNVTATQMLYERAAISNVSAIVHFSSAAVYAVNNAGLTTEAEAFYAGKDFWYAHHKAVMEHWLDGFQRRWPDLRVIRLRPSLVLGTHTPTPMRALLLNPWYPKTMTGCMQCLAEADLAQAVCSAVHYPRHAAFNLAGEDGLTIAEIKTLLVGRAVALPDFGARLWALAHGLSKTSGILQWIRRLRDPMLLDCTSARQHLQWRPRYDSGACVRAFGDMHHA